MNKSLAKYIDHTLLKPDADQRAIDKLLTEALNYEFASVCVNPLWVSYCHEKLKDSPVEVCTVIGFPLGASVSTVKAYETKQAIEDGATEVDMVINISALKNKKDQLVADDIAAVVNVAKENKVLTKVIIETCLLTDEEKVRACEIAKASGADFVKTSTGFSSGGATISDVELMRNTVGPSLGVKASGGVKNNEQAKAMIKAGATRIGASASVTIVQE
ncbi:deoxyribose-phosphate aldolase [Ornithinibacillus sp. 4-3]|uniref:Deoxyribose-phosphate aldolase n=1 Tax=Ornithinibacillus sp. 4-3 TaxID=3231488 RepID=A0AB39HJU7_9BACI